MNHHTRAVAAALLSACLSAGANADEATTKGGIKIKSADGNFSASIGGRIHFDLYAFDSDESNPTGSTDFRRARITLKGNIYDWKYVLEQDFAAGSTLNGFRDVFVAREFSIGELRIGQFKPFRSMDEMTSSNELTMMERAYSSGTGLFRGRQFQQGIGFLAHEECYTYGLMAFNLRNTGTPRNEGVGTSGRFTWAPINNDWSTLHLGMSLSYQNANQGSLPLEAEADYAGRRGPRQLIALTPAFTGGDASSAGLELAGTYGPLYLQAEYAYGHFEGNYYLSETGFENLFDAPAPFFCDPDLGCYIDSQNVHTWYLMGSWLLTGEHKPYNGKKGVFKSAKPNGSGLWGGAWELTARYDTIENTGIRKLETSTTTVGVNYYVNPQVRFMLNLTFGDNDFTGDDTNQLGLRAQIHW